MHILTYRRKCDTSNHKNNKKNKEKNYIFSFVLINNSNKSNITILRKYISSSFAEEHTHTNTFAHARVFACMMPRIIVALLLKNTRFTEKKSKSANVMAATTATIEILKGKKAKRKHIE